ncbi:Endoribonuclease [Candidatus Filomicrobium marinum]|uniref:Endoribonuclease n=2 Tax=Filomicrobium TaxID=119044 RepID=A0A0D6JB42_9HYPH|nr:MULTISPECIES: RidA family protein [Filomicrobium]CFX01175.1 Endoribonuclease [Candidatus Filomicrobium marinum]CPR15399.1 Endoribonuclease [Candidatus Filomicrobium marinum]SDO65800.1 Enamine deaminase RidA, house cleaning of reactive enamine intermediates, YjgF/YER057c/UK114 family [Filomicrobium insigne]
MSDDVKSRLKAKGLTLPSAPAAVANYVPYCVVGDLLYISGQISKAADGSLIAGKLGADLTVEQGMEAAAACALNILAQTNAAVGDLNRIAQLVRITGYVNATPDFTDHPRVVNGASDLFVELLGDAGRHTRAAVGVSSLPANCAVEIDAIVRIKD